MYCIFQHSSCANNESSAWAVLRKTKHIKHKYQDMVTSHISNMNCSICIRKLIVFSTLPMFLLVLDKVNGCKNPRETYEDTRAKLLKNKTGYRNEEWFDHLMAMAGGVVGLLFLCICCTCCANKYKFGQVHKREDHQELEKRMRNYMFEIKHANTA